MSSPVPIELRIETDPVAYTVRFDPLSALPDLLVEAGLEARRVVLITDENVRELYGETLRKRLEAAGREVLEVGLPPGEPTKSAEHLSLIHDRVLDWGIERRTPVVALGGGVIGDLAGFASATLLRGVPLVQCPTTLIGQADSAIGGKTGINHRTGKNLIGAFKQPELVLCDLETLQTLPDREWTSGLAEVLKYGFIQDRALYRYLRTHWGSVADRDPEAIRQIVPRSAGVKVDVVERDVHEAGVRSFLNFGHTVGHAVEKASGYGTITHGEAVAIGMIAALYLSRLHHPEIPLEEGVELLLRLPLPVPPEDLSIEELWRTMASDKKTVDGQVRFVLLEEPGRPVLSDAVDREEVADAWTFAKDRLRGAGAPTERETNRDRSR